MQFQPWDNPMGTDGFEFVEYAAPDPKAMGALFEQMGFTAIARHRHKDVTLYRQGEINFLINAEPDSFAQRFARQHGPSVCAIAIRVDDAAMAYRRALELGAWGFDNKNGPMELNIPAIKGVGDSLLYFVDRWRGKNAGKGAPAGSIGDISIYDVDFVAIPGAEANPVGNGLTYIDHLTHNVHRGRMKEWAGVLREPVQLPRSALLRHRGQADRPEVEGDDFAVRQDPHPDQRVVRRQVADRRIPRPVPRRGHPAHRARHRRHLRRRSSACATPASPSRTPSRPTTSWSTGACRATARTSTNCAACAS